QLHQLVGKIAPGDRIAILRAGAGSARERQLTADARILRSSIDALDYLGGGFSPPQCATAAWSTVGLALGGLESLPGRKAVVLWSGQMPAPAGNAARELERLAAHSAAAIYQVGDAAPLLSLSTGGASGLGLDRILEEQQSYYVVSFEHEEPRSF